MWDGSASGGGAVQICARCGTQWPVRGVPQQWCAYCRGVLLAPSRLDAPAPVRAYRWVARAPERPRRPIGLPSRPAATPRYDHVPPWGLLDPPPSPPQAMRRPLGRLAARLRPLLIATTVLFVLAAGAELGRYGVLLVNRSRLISPIVLAISDALVWACAGLALLFGLLSALAAVGWLIDRRQARFAELGRSDPRRVRTLVAGCVVPVVNLVAPGVLLTELVAGRSRSRRRAVRVWWCVWLVGAGFAAAAVAWRIADTLQAQANGVLFTAFTDVVAAGVAATTLWLVGELDGRDVRGRRPEPRRWLVATGPAEPVIEPIRPVEAAPWEKVLTS
ncbi:MAG TPA: DUF4328 domain-containing protein [Aldersonia sp.]